MYIKRKQKLARLHENRPVCFSFQRIYQIATDFIINIESDHENYA